MQISRFKYSEFPGQPREWSMEEVQLGPITLVVGRNSAGKSRTLNLIAGLASLLGADRKPNFKSGVWEMTFVDGVDELHYELIIVNSAVTHEKFLKNGKELLIRSATGEGRIWAEKAHNFLEFQTPPTELAAVTRRDTLQHGFFDSLYQWGKGMRHFRFGTQLGKDSFAVILNDKTIQYDPKDTDAAIGTFRRGQKEFGEDFIKAVIADMARVDYEIEEVGLMAPVSIALQGPVDVSTLVGLYTKERKLNAPVEQHEMSQGMFRALSVIIQLNYASLSKQPSCILIDDIGEGLDFERSCALVKLLVEKETSSGVQLIMSTNDRFVMNSVPLEHWAVIVRDAGKAKIFNYANSKEKFEDFKFTGLNNFDFFATDYLQQRGRSS